LDCVNGRRDWGKPLDVEVGRDVDAVLGERGRRAVELSREEEWFVRCKVSYHLSEAADHFLKFARWVKDTAGIGEAVKAVTDANSFERYKEACRREKGSDPPLSGAVSKSYWMSDLVESKVCELFDGANPVSLWDWGASSGMRLFWIKQRLGGKVSAHATDLAYQPHHPLDGVHLMTFETAPKSLAGGIDVSIAQASLQYSILPHVAVRNILACTRHAAYLTFDGYSGVTWPFLSVSDPELQGKFSRYVLGYEAMHVDKRPQLKSDIQFNFDGRICKELLAAQERGFDVKVSLGRNNEGFISVDEMLDEPNTCNKIIAVRK